MDIILVQISPICYGSSRETIECDSLVIERVEQKAVILIDAAIYVGCIADISNFLFLPLFLVELQGSLFVVYERIKSVACYFAKAVR